MTFQYCSDLHLELKENNQFILKNPIIPKAPLLLLCGDILPFALDHRNYVFFDHLSANFDQVYWLPGNHEYYGSDISAAANPLFEEIRPRVFLVNNCTLTYQDVHLVASTMWTRIATLNQSVLQKRLTDFSAITNKGSLLVPADYNALHQLSLLFIMQELNRLPGEKKIVFTHHIPTFSHYPAKYKNSALTEGFAVELSGLIESSGITAWIYGHHHVNVQPFLIGSTVLLTNQLGYVRKREHKTYNRSAVFEM